MGRDRVVAWLRLAADRIHDRRAWLTELDAAIGDGDHGINLDRGFQAVLAEIDGGRWAALSTGGTLAATGSLLLGTVGGASGALYGRAFQRAGRALEAREVDGRTNDAVAAAGDVDGLDSLVKALEAAIEAIAQLGHSRPGEKTMLDALVPAAAALAATAPRGSAPSPDRRLDEAIRRAATAAAAGADATIPLLARKGRASYLGPRSIGHMDPGAASSALILGALADSARDAVNPEDARDAALD